MLRPPKIGPPDCPRPFAPHELDDNSQWFQYPRLGNIDKPPQPALQRYTFDEQCELANLGFDISTFLFSPDNKFLSGSDMWNIVDDLHRRLIRWHNSLPVCLELGEHPIPIFIHLR